MIAGYVIVQMHQGRSPLAVLATGVGSEGAVYASRNSIERNRQWADSQLGRAHFHIPPTDTVEVMELHSIIEEEG